MASRCSSLSLPLPWLLLLVVLLVLGDDAVAAMAMPRPLLGIGIAEPPTVLQGTAAGPASGASRPGGRGRKPDWSMAGAEVILAGFAAAVMIIVFCYIRITRKNNGSTCNGTSDVGVMGVGVEKQQQRL